MPAEKCLVHGDWDCTEVYPKLNNVSPGLNDEWSTNSLVPWTNFSWSSNTDFRQNQSSLQLLYCLHWLTTELLGMCGLDSVFPPAPHRRAKTEESIILVLARNGRPHQKSARTTR